MTHQQSITGITAHSVAAVRWPGYTITGAGPLAVALHCAGRVLLVMTPLEAHALAANRCCADCSHAVAPAGGWHTIHKLDAQRNEAPRRRMRRLPGWDED